MTISNDKRTLLEDKARQWREIEHLARLLNISHAQPGSNALCYEQAAAYGLIPSALGSTCYVALDIESILRGDGPLFVTINNIPEYEQRRDEAAARDREASERRIKQEQAVMGEKRKKLEGYLKADGSLLNVHEIDNNTVLILLDGYESKKGRK